MILRCKMAFVPRIWRWTLSRTWLITLIDWINRRILMEASKIGLRVIKATVSIRKARSTIIQVDSQTRTHSRKSAKMIELICSSSKQLAIVKRLKRDTLTSVNRRKLSNGSSPLQSPTNICCPAPHCSRFNRSLSAKRLENNRRKLVSRTSINSNSNKSSKTELQVKTENPLNLSSQLRPWRDNLKTGLFFLDKISITIITTTIIVSTWVVRHEFLAPTYRRKTNKCSRVHQSILTLWLEKKTKYIDFNNSDPISDFTKSSRTLTFLNSIENRSKAAIVVHSRSEEKNPPPQLYERCKELPKNPKALIVKVCRAANTPEDLAHPT